jgi:hypothetical protein
VHTHVARCSALLLQPPLCLILLAEGLAHRNERADICISPGGTATVGEGEIPTAPDGVAAAAGVGGSTDVLAACVRSRSGRSGSGRSTWRVGGSTVGNTHGMPQGQPGSHTPAPLPSAMQHFADATHAGQMRRTECMAPMRVGACACGILGSSHTTQLRNSRIRDDRESWAA